VPEKERSPEMPQAPNGPGLLIHAAGRLEPNTLAGILRSSANARAALTPGTAIEVVVQGPGVRLLAADSRVGDAITHSQHLNVEILACANSLRSAGLDAEELAAGISAVPAAVAHLAERQYQGWSYVRS
jgi:uncharacterized protein